METEDEHCTDGNSGNETDLNILETPANVYDAKDGKEIDDIKKCDMKDKPFFMNVPIEE